MTDSAFSPEADPLYLEARSAFAQGEHARATTLCARALAAHPRHPPACLLLARIAEEVQAPEKALPLARQALALDPALAEAHLTLARLLPRLGRPAEASLHWQHYHHLRPKDPLPLPVPAAMFFENRDEAAAQAKVAPLLPTGPGGHARMLCFHPAPALTDAPPHLIPVPEESLEGFFATTPLRRPAWVRFNPARPESARHAETLARRLDAASLAREQEGSAALAAMGELPPAPPWDGERPPRLCLLASRHDGEAHAAMTGLARALRDLGCAVRLICEENEREALDPVRLMDQLRGFNPHGVIAANAFPREFLHPERFAVSWWLEPPPRPPISLPPWGERDILLHANDAAEAFLRKLGAPEGLRQPLCIEPPLPGHPPEARENLLLVVADRPPALLLGKPVQEVLLALAEVVDKHERVTPARLAAWSQACGLGEGMLLSLLCDTLVRERLPGWLADLKGITVALLGHGWEEEPRVQGLHQGQIPEGEALEGWYGRARWALVLSPHGRGSRQAQEALARGVVPILYDGLPTWNPPRRQEPLPHFHAPEGLRQALSSDTAPPFPASETPFTRLADRLVEEMGRRLK